MADNKVMPNVTGEMQNKIDRASILIEALPYMRKMRGQTIVIKYGGNAMVNEDLKQSVMDDITLLKYIGINPILVHGGGPDINNMLKRVNVESHFVNGLRYTDEETMGIAQMVLIGKTNKEIVSNLNSKGAKAIGICGIDGNLIVAEKMTEDSSGNPVDVGYVGKIKKINTHVIEMLANDEYIPVIARRSRISYLHPRRRVDRGLHRRRRHHRRHDPQDRRLSRYGNERRRQSTYH